MIKKLSHVCFRTPDLEATRRFYGDLLGMGIRFTFLNSGELQGLYFDAGNGSFIEVFMGETEGKDSTSRHFCFEVDSIDDLIARFDAAGQEHTGKKMGTDSSWQVWTNDPNGNSVEFQEYTENSSQLTGATCIIDW